MLFAARASKTRAAATATTGIKVVAMRATRVLTASQTSGRFKDLLKEKCPWHLEGNHTTE
jgi:hypothetical protein